MSTFIPTTTVAVLSRTAATDSYGDEVESDAVLAGFTDLPAYISEISERAFDPTTGRATVIEGVSIRLRPNAFPFAPHDRVRDNTTGIVYQIDTVNSKYSLNGYADIRLTAKQVS